MKRIIAVVFALALACGSMALVAGCGGGGGGGSVDYTGTWVCSAVDDGTTVTSIDELEALGITGDQFMTLELRADGTVDMTVFGTSAFADSGITVNWEATDSGVTLSGQGVSFDLPYDSGSGELAMEYEGQKVLMKKK